RLTGPPALSSPRSATLGFLLGAGAAERPRRRMRRRGERPGAGPSSSLSAQRAELVPVVVPVEGRSGEDSVERERSRDLTQARWRPRVSEDSYGDHSSPSNRLRTCRSPVRVGAGAFLTDRIRTRSRELAP